jgi:hypothetical protein
MIDRCRRPLAAPTCNLCSAHSLAVSVVACAGTSHGGRRNAVVLFNPINAGEQQLDENLSRANRAALPRKGQKAAAGHWPGTVQDRDRPVRRLVQK